MEVSFITQCLSLFFLGAVSIGAYLISKNFKISYTILLVFIGILLIPLSKIYFFSFIDDFVLTPDILFFVFLPILIFESGYNIGYRQLLDNWKSISLLAVIGLLISTFCIGFGIYYVLGFFGINIPLELAFLFGAIISATDPVAVLALFKTYGAPKRLALIFEGESLFNDGTALALFLVILEIIHKGTFGSNDLIFGIVSFIVMIVGGTIFGGFMGYIFSKIIGKITNSDFAEIGITMILAHTTFILSEMISENFVIYGFEIQVSGVIATSIAAIVAGNYGRYKISFKVREFMDKFWGFTAFVSNSFIFLLIGLTLSKINVNIIDYLFIISLIIIIVVVARGISVYIPIGILNIFKVEKNISYSRQHLLAWGSLRGALALMIVQLIPSDLHINGWEYDISIKDFLMVLTISCVLFTLFIKGLTISWFIKVLGINKLDGVEEFERYEGKILIYLELLKKVKHLNNNGYINTNEFDILNKKYETKLNESIKNLKSFFKNQEENTNELMSKVLSLHALGIEKQYLKELFNYNEIDEKIFNYMLRKINRQIERLENGQPQFRKEGSEEFDFYDKIINFLTSKHYSNIDLYLRYRAKNIISNKVLIELDKLKNIDFGFDKKLFIDLIDKYKVFNEKSKEKINNISEIDENLKILLNTILINKSLIKEEEKIIGELNEKQMITNKLYSEFMSDIDKEIYKDIKRLDIN